MRDEHFSEHQQQDTILIPHIPISTASLEGNSCSKWLVHMRNVYTGMSMQGEMGGWVSYFRACKRRAVLIISLIEVRGERMAACGGAVPSQMGTHQGAWSITSAPHGLFQSPSYISTEQTLQ